VTSQEPQRCKTVAPSISAVRCRSVTRLTLSGARPLNG
jgi:hypothetical protein